jgi:class 3 adenylate cyclase
MSTDCLRHRAIVAIDMEGSTTRTNPAKGHLRQAMYDLFEHALHAAGITEHQRDPFIDRGDGILALVHPADCVPKTTLLSVAIPKLATLLNGHNHNNPKQRLRLRAVIHAGEVHYDDHGCYGESLDIAFRLLDAPEVKTQLRQTTMPLALVISDDIHRAIVRHNYPGIAKHIYRRAIRIHVTGHTHHGWLHHT